MAALTCALIMNGACDHNHHILPGPATTSQDCQGSSTSTAITPSSPLHAALLLAFMSAPAARLQPCEASTASALPVPRSLTGVPAPTAPFSNNNTHHHPIRGGPFPYLPRRSVDLNQPLVQIGRLDRPERVTTGRTTWHCQWAWWLWLVPWRLALLYL